jgi:hypothetical protein
MRMSEKTTGGAYLARPILRRPGAAGLAKFEKTETFK